MVVGVFRGPHAPSRRRSSLFGNLAPVAQPATAPQLLSCPHLSPGTDRAAPSQYCQGQQLLGYTYPMGMFPPPIVEPHFVHTRSGTFDTPEPRSLSRSTARAISPLRCLLGANTLTARYNVSTIWH